MEAPQSDRVAVPVRVEDDGRTIYDLDQYRAARHDQAPTSFIHIGGMEVPLPRSTDVPLDVIDLLATGEGKQAVHLLFGPDWGPRVWDTNPTLGEMQIIAELVMGAPMGE